MPLSVQSASRSSLSYPLDIDSPVTILVDLSNFLFYLLPPDQTDGLFVSTVNFSFRLVLACDSQLANAEAPDIANEDQALRTETEQRSIIWNQFSNL